MLKSITSTSKYIITSGSQGLPYISPGAVGAGMLRFNNNTQNIEVNDGNSWHMMAGSISTVSMSSEAESLFDWARQKRDEEMAWQSLAKDHQAVKIALDNLEEAQRQVDVTAKLAREYDTSS